MQPGNHGALPCSQSSEQEVYTHATGSTLQEVSTYHIKSKIYAFCTISPQQEVEKQEYTRNLVIYARVKVQYVLLTTLDTMRFIL